MKRFNPEPVSAVKLSDDLIQCRQIEFKEFELSNGLHCILYKDSFNPIVNVTVGYKVGSKDEDKNKKGIAHLFEHLMFQGSDNVKKNEHFQYVMKAGGTSNAFTMQDATVYFESMPSNNLETALWLESDRMNSLDLTDENLSNQKSVVIEEKMQRYDNAPYGSMVYNVFKNLFKGSNYESQVIGEVEDINSFTVEEAKEFHSNYYSPENSVLLVLGDINYVETEKLINKYFSGINKHNTLPRKVNKIENINKDIDLTVYDNIRLPALNICYKLPKAGTKEDYTYDFFTEIIANNKSSRLHKKLIYERKLLKSIKAMKFMLEDAGVLIINAIVNPGINIDLVKKEIFIEVNDLVLNGCTDEEFNKIRNQLEFHNTIKNSKLMNISIETIFNYLYHKDTSAINTDIRKYLAVTKQEVVNSVKEFVCDSNKLVLQYLPMNLKN